jgi:hypothetical protein
MAKTDPVNIANPAGPSDPKFGDDYIRTLARAVIELINKDHYVGTATDNAYDEDDAGEHAKATLRAAAADPSSAAEKYFLYAKTSGDIVEFYGEDSSGNVVRFSRAGKVNLDANIIANDTALLADNAAGTGTVTIVKVTTGDIAQLSDGAQVAAACVSGDDALTIVTKGYADDKISGDIASATGLWKSGSMATVRNENFDVADQWYDLDLSEYVGEREALVFLEIYSASTVRVGAKTKGAGGADLGAWRPHEHYGAGCYSVHLYAGDYGTIIVATDSSGVIQVAGATTGPVVRIRLIGYIN